MVAYISSIIPVLFIAALIIVAIGVVVILLGIIGVSNNRSSVSQRIQVFVENKEKIPEPGSKFRFIPRELSGSFFARTIKPVAEKIIDFFGRFTPSYSITQSDFKLAIAGNPFGIHAQEYYGIRVIFLLTGVAVGILLNFKSGFSDLIMMLLGGAIIVFMLMIPMAWLDNKVKERQNELRRNLPDALDMLSVCAAAGLGFDQSLKTPLSAEFRHVLQDMDIGETRAEALRSMSQRIDVSEISSFIAIIIQAESIGMSFSDVLHSQAKQMRILRQFRAKEIANSLPAKMILPIVLFIFPALIAVIIAPIIPTLMEMF
jgi:tight adherence protein C